MTVKISQATCQQLSRLNRRARCLDRLADEAFHHGDLETSRKLASEADAYREAYRAVYRAAAAAWNESPSGAA